jgi:hypothetical protein
MGYAVMFYAMDGNGFARQLRDSCEELLEKVRQQSKACGDPGYVIDVARRICRDEIPDRLPRSFGLDYFYALCWLAEVASERVQICSFQGFRSLAYLDEIGIWPWLLRRPPPFPVPRSGDEAPSVGYLPVNDIQRFALPEFARLPLSRDQDVVNARDEFRDVLETLIPDHLDLLAVLVY